MATLAAADRLGVRSTTSSAHERFAGACAILAGALTLRGYLGYGVAALQIVLYLGRLIIFDAKNPVIAVPALLAGFLATPIFYIWLGVSLWRGARA